MDAPTTVLDRIKKLLNQATHRNTGQAEAEAFLAEHGHECWELDALDPGVMHDLIRDAVLRVRDEERWSRSLAREASERDRLDLALSELDL